MSLRSQVLAASLLAMALSWSSQALSYSRASGISYAVGSLVVSGYSRTWKDPWDADYYNTCISWVWDDIYGYYCYAYNLQINYAHVDSDLDTPTGFFHLTHTDLYDALVTYAVPIASQSGTWTVTGRHRVKADVYIYWCPYMFCTSPAYVGTHWFSAGNNTTAQQAVIQMSISRYVTTSLTNPGADAILANASALLQTNDGGGDVPCPLTFQRSGSVTSFSVGNGIIDNEQQLLAVMAQGPERVQFVNEINWCGATEPPPPPFYIAGCSSGAGIVVRDVPTNQRGTLWAHEYGHNQSLVDTTTPGFVMYHTLNQDNRRVTQWQCNAMRDPLN